MTIQEYFGDWTKVIDLSKVNTITNRLKPYNKVLCPKLHDVFKAFRLCKLQDVRVVIIGQDPYPNYVKGIPVATGLAFANSSNTLEKDYSPSLKVLRDSFMDIDESEERIIFDPSLESWEKQGVLLLNTALSCLQDQVRSHTLLWRPFITSFLDNLNKYLTGVVYVLMGNDALSLEPYIKKDFNYIIKTKHPAYYARKHIAMPNIWNCINQILIGQNGYGIKWYNTLNFKENEEVFYFKH